MRATNSKILEIAQRMLIGLKSEIVEAAFTLCNGRSIAFFQSEGKWPDWSDASNMFIRDREITGRHSLRCLRGIPSGPIALERAAENALVM